MRIDIYDVHNVVLVANEQTTHGNIRRRSFLRAKFEEAQQTDKLTIFVADGASSRKRRQAIYSGYKAKRPDMAEDKRAGIDLFKEVMTLSRAMSVCCEGWEADDVIGTLARQLASYNEVYVHTNDSDFGQLYDYPGLHFPRLATPPCPPVYVTLYKAMVGDSADNIPGMPGLGKETFEAMKAFWPLLEVAFRTQDHHAFMTTPWPRPSLAKTAARPEVWRGLLAFYAIVHLLPVPNEDLDKGTILGANRPDLAEKIFQEFML